jgi:hypothetical protein
MIKWLLALVYVMALWVPFFNRAEPALFGFPFFYWYQMAAVLVGAALIFIVYLVEDRGDAK